MLRCCAVGLATQGHSGAATKASRGAEMAYGESRRRPASSSSLSKTSRGPQPAFDATQLGHGCHWLM